MTDAEAASFVLAYLLKNNYPQTATSFLEECHELPSKTFLILPETPLQSIIASHKSRSDTGVLVNTLGPSNAWKALWTKLDHTLQQLRTLYEDGLQTSKQGPSSLSHRPRTNRQTYRKLPPPSSQPHINVAPSSQPHSLLPTSSQPPLSSQPPPSSQPHTQPPLSSQPPPSSQLHKQPHSLTTSTMSPRRRKTAPKRLDRPSTPDNSHMLTSQPLRTHTSAGPPSPNLQQVLDSLLEDNELPGKLADIINKCVSKEDCTSGLFSLDDILDRTYSDPALEGLISHVTTASDHVTNPGSNAGPSTDHVTSQKLPDQSPPAKKTKVSEGPLTEQDIDDFLDQLHS